MNENDLFALLREEEELKQKLDRLRKDINSIKDVDVSNSFFRITRNYQGKKDIDYQSKFPYQLRFINGFRQDHRGKNKEYVLAFGTFKGIVDMLKEVEIAASEMQKKINTGDIEEGDDEQTST